MKTSRDASPGPFLNTSRRLGGGVDLGPPRGKQEPQGSACVVAISGHERLKQHGRETGERPGNIPSLFLFALVLRGPRVNKAQLPRRQRLDRGRLMGGNQSQQTAGWTW
jgi:hypothetical protein